MAPILFPAQFAGRLYRALVRSWNWKTALLSTIFRSVIFFAVNLRSGWGAAGAALLTEFFYRSCPAGFCGAVTQSLRRVEPAWKGVFAGLVVLPAAQHTLEFVVHSWRGTPHVRSSVLVSVFFTGLSTLFHLYAMRRGALLVEHGAAPLGEDLKRIPALLAGFLLAPWRLCRSLRTALVFPRS